MTAATVADAFDALTVESLRRRGSLKWSTYGPEVLPAWVAEMDFPPAPAVQAAMQSAVDRGDYGYPPFGGGELGAACAEWQQQAYGWSVDPDRVHALPDVLKGVELGITAYTPADSPVVLPTPAYMPFFAVVAECKRPLVEVPMGYDGDRPVLDLEGIAAAFAAGARSVILCNPNNPMGRVLTREELLALADVVTEHGAIVVADEIHSPLTFPGHPHVPYASLDERTAAHTITLVSASKGWNLPGLKCAQIVLANDRHEATWQTLPMLRTHGVSILGLQANVAAYREGGLWLTETLRYLDGNRQLLAELLAEHLPEVGYRPPEGTYLTWLDFRALKLPDEPAEVLLDKARVAVNPGLPFGAPGAGHVRLNIATSRGILEQIVLAMAGVVSGA